MTKRELMSDRVPRPMLCCTVSPRKQTSRGRIRGNGVLVFVFVCETVRKRDPGGSEPGILVVRRAAKRHRSINFLSTTAGNEVPLVHSRKVSSRLGVSLSKKVPQADGVPGDGRRGLLFDQFVR